MHNDGARPTFLFDKECEFPGISSSTELLMRQVLQEDNYPAFQLLFYKMYRPLVSFSLRFVQLPEVAEEIVSDVFYTIWKNRRNIHVTSPKSYLYAAVRNRCFDYLRSAKRTTFCTLEHAEHLPSENHTLHEILEHEELELYITQRIGMLPRQCKIIFELSREEGLKYREIAEELSISVKTVEAQMGKALKHLRKLKASSV